MPRRTFGFVIFAAALALGCIRLGFWQLSRHEERRTRNAVTASRTAAPPASIDELTRDSASARHRQVRVVGRYDYGQEIVLTSRSRSGAPGVNILTPLIVSEGEAAVLVNRGWAYAPDGMRVDLGKWREADTATVVGYAEEFIAADGPISTRSAVRAVRRLDRDSIAVLLPYPIAPVVVVQRLGAALAGSLEHPSRLDLPALDEGPHLSYAFQWFAFAAIAIVGAGAVAMATQRSGGAPPPGR